MKKVWLGVLAMVASVMMPVLSVGVYAESNEMIQNICDDTSGTFDDIQKQTAGCETAKSATQVAVSIINAVISVVGVLAVLVIAVAGQRFLSADGDAAKVAAAKNMVLYAVIGLILSMMAFAVINFVAGVIKNNANTNAATSAVDIWVA